MEKIIGIQKHAGKIRKRSIYVQAVVPRYCFTAEQTRKVDPFSIYVNNILLVGLF